jgi:hypothetical protein
MRSMKIKEVAYSKARGGGDVDVEKNEKHKTV